MRQAYADITKLQQLSGNAKLAFLDSGVAQHESTLAVLAFVFNPYVKTGIGAKKLRNSYNFVGKPSTDKDYRTILDYFTENQTGNDVDLAMAWYYMESYEEPEVQEFIGKVISQDIQCGVNATSLNKVYGKDFIPTIGCMLGRNIDKVSRVKWPVIITQKLDGVRRLVFNRGGVARFYSRSGHEYTGHDEIAEEIVKYLPTGFMYDGELLAEGKFVDIIAQRQATMSRSALKGTKTGLSFHIFDMVPLKEVDSGYFIETAIQRKIRLAATFDDPSGYLIDKDYEMRKASFVIPGTTELRHVYSVPILGVANVEEQIEPHLAYMRSIGAEGVMLNVAAAPYQMKRTNDLIKVKFVKEYVVKCVGFVEGSNKYEGSLGALVVEYETENGKIQLGVGSGFTDFQRDLIWESQEDFVDKLLEIESFGESTNMQGGHSLNCPIFKRWVGAAE